MSEHTIALLAAVDALFPPDQWEFQFATLKPASRSTVEVSLFCTRAELEALRNAQQTSSDAHAELLAAAEALLDHVGYYSESDPNWSVFWTHVNRLRNVCRRARGEAPPA